MSVATQSVWMGERLPGFAPLPGDRRVDVAVVGGGLTGITAAWMLSQRGRRVAIVEAEGLGAGETSRTTAHLSWALDTRFATLRSRFGREVAAVAAHAHQAAIDWIEQAVADLAIDCDFARVPGFLYTDGGDAGDQAFADEAEAAADLGLPVSEAPAIPLPFTVRRALRFANQAQFHPLRYLGGLARALVRDGGTIYERTRVLGVEDGEPCRLITDRGTITANAVVVAAHVPVNNRVFLHTKLEPMRSYVLAVEADFDLPPALLWDLATPYHYWRTLVHEGRRLLLVGGGDHKVGEEPAPEGGWEGLEAYLADRLRRRPRVVQRWSGQIIEPVDGLCYVGRNSLSTRVFVATGYSGNGVTGATAAAMILADEVNGEVHPWSDVFAATRVTPVASARAFVRQNASAARHMVTDRWRRQAHGSVADIPAGEGRVVHVAGEALAVYREPTGHLRTLSAVCTHLGCQVAWNGAERSWDCPCHGSRYAPDGEVINGPAVRALERRDLATVSSEESEKPDGGQPGDPATVPVG
jgi:glycine/D-amino acid oxidase-like deaminating enzyme/nitrite reductase/ring-hydroxylating ferredoxin subunit